jgi:hypothetical protein
VVEHDKDMIEQADYVDYIKPENTARNYQYWYPAETLASGYNHMHI